MSLRETAPLLPNQRFYLVISVMMRKVDVDDDGDQSDGDGRQDMNDNTTVISNLKVKQQCKLGVNLAKGFLLDF